MQNKPTIVDYRMRIGRMVEYISNHLDENPDLKTLAEAAGVSPYHFHRIAKAFLGETIGNFIVRKRVETAARLLRYTDLPVCQIAYGVGYEEPASLTKAFKLFFGITPNEFRNDKKEITMKQLNINPDLELKERIEIREPKNGICYGLKGDYHTCDYEKAWKTLNEFATAEKIDMGQVEYLTIYYDDPDVTESDKQRADVCMVPNKECVPTGELRLKQIPGGRYAIYLYKGTYQKLGMVYDTIYGKYIPEGGYQLDARPMFERYLNDPEETRPEDLLTEIYVPIV